MSSNNNFNAKPCINRKLLIFKWFNNSYIAFRTSEKKTLELFIFWFSNKISPEIYLYAFFQDFTFPEQTFYKYLRILNLYIYIFASHTHKNIFVQSFWNNSTSIYINWLATASNFWMGILFFLTCDCFIKKSFSNKLLLYGKCSQEFFELKIKVANVFVIRNSSWNSSIPYRT